MPKIVRKKGTARPAPGRFYVTLDTVTQPDEDGWVTVRLLTYRLWEDSEKNAVELRFSAKTGEWDGQSPAGRERRHQAGGRPSGDGLGDHSEPVRRGVRKAPGSTGSYRGAGA